MARFEDRLPENVEGEFFVDSTCIDCDTCRQLAPEVFAESRRAHASFVQAQPRDGEQTHRALMSLVACPTASIGTVHKHDVRAAKAAFPQRIEGGVYYCGYCAESSFGASSYLIVREGGNVLVDSPRFAGDLKARIEALGGVRYLFLTHRDDVADHRKWTKALRCERVMHRDDLSSSTADVERVVEGQGATTLAADLTVVPVPGHTRGSAALLHREFCFSGDHLWATDDQKHLDASSGVNWYSWSAQAASVEKLAAFDFTWVLPGHGRRYRAESADAMKRELVDLSKRMRRSG